MANTTRPQAPSLEARASMIDGTFELPKSNQDAIPRIRAILANAAQGIIGILNSADAFDYGTATRSIQALQESKDLACQALILPYAPTVKTPGQPDNK